MRPAVLSVVALLASLPAGAQDEAPSAASEQSTTSQEAAAEEAGEAPAAQPAAAPSATEVVDPAAAYARRIDASFQAQAASTVLSCMSRAPGKVRKLGGELALVITVEADGSLSAVQPQEEGSTLDHGKTLACLSQGFSIVVLPKPPDGSAPLSLAYSMSIHPVD